MATGVTAIKMSVAASAGTPVHSGRMATGPKKFIPKEPATKESGIVAGLTGMILPAILVSLCRLYCAFVGGGP
jgi:hypothetical protein